VRFYEGARKACLSVKLTRAQIGAAPVATVKNTAISMTKEGGMFGSTEAANSVANWTYLIAGSLAVLFTATTVAASFVMWKTSTEISDEKDRQLSRFQAEAKERTATLEKEAARANERAARLENEAAQARLEQERLKAALAWRTLSKSQIDSLSGGLSRNPGSVNIRYTDGDPEALFLAIQIGNLLSAAKWNVAPGAVKFQNALTFQIHVEGGENADAKSLRDALTEASIPFTTEPSPPVGAGFSISTIQGAPTLTIGSKPPSLQ
jgi:hypothetical protein